MHVVGIALGWALFVFGWIRVAALPWDAHGLWVLIVVSAIVLPTLTAIWIAHNLALYRGRLYDVDWAGHPVHADWSALASADRIRIDVESGAKRYRMIATVPIPFAVGAAPAPDDTVAAPTTGVAP